MRKLARLLLVLLTIILTISTFVLHRQFVEAMRRSYEESARAHFVGDFAPQLVWRYTFNVESADQVTLNSMRGRVMLIDFWATSCEACVRTLPSLDILQRRFPNELLVVSITKLNGAMPPVAEFWQINEFVETHGVHHPVLVADKNINVTNYEVRTLPTAVLVGRDGRVINYWVGDRGVDDSILETEALLGRTAENYTRRSPGADLARSIPDASPTR